MIGRLWRWLWWGNPVDVYVSEAWLREHIRDGR